MPTRSFWDNVISGLSASSSRRPPVPAVFSDPETALGNARFGRRAPPRDAARAPSHPDRPPLRLAFFPRRSLWESVRDVTRWTSAVALSSWRRAGTPAFVRRALGGRRRRAQPATAPKHALPPPPSAAQDRRASLPRNAGSIFITSASTPRCGPRVTAEPRTPSAPLGWRDPARRRHVVAPLIAAASSGPRAAVRALITAAKDALDVDRREMLGCIRCGPPPAGHRGPALTHSPPAPIRTRRAVGRPVVAAARGARTCAARIAARTRASGTRMAGRRCRGDVRRSTETRRR